MVSDHKGRRTRRFRALAKLLRSKGHPCWLCTEPIDYTLSHEDLRAFSVDHKEPKSKRPDLAEVYSNLRAAHRECNDKKGAGEYTPQGRLLGRLSESW